VQAAIDFRSCLNALSDVIINRPPPLRIFDQIYMKLPDMLLQAELIGRWFGDKRVLFVGDGDAIALSLVHLNRQNLITSGPSCVKVIDFDQRIVNSINHFASYYDLQDVISAELYNVADALPESHWQSYDAFYTNPPWGKSNNGESVCAFIERGIEAVQGSAIGCVVIGDHRKYAWTHTIQYKTQRLLMEGGFRVAEMLPEFHHYHLDDAPDLTSCSLVVHRCQEIPVEYRSEKLPPHRLANFYGAENPLRHRYVLDKTNGGKRISRDVEFSPYEEAD
jgi:N4-bis(aminopropyl)spermidine synthase